MQYSGVMSRRDWRWKWVTKKSTGSFTLGAISQGAVMICHQKWFHHPFYCASSCYRPKSYNQTTRESLISPGKLPVTIVMPSVISSAIFDAPTPCCGVTCHCRIAPTSTKYNFTLGAILRQGVMAILMLLWVAWKSTSFTLYRRIMAWYHRVS